MSDTIFAIASGSGISGIAVLRLSGPRVTQVIEMLAGKLPVPRHATLLRLRDPADGETIDRALVLSFPAPASFTGETYAELHLHGSRAIQHRMLGLLAALPGCRPAEPGEFTLRAFRAGKMDLTEVEGLGDLLAAETEAQRKQALRLMEGALGRRADAWRAEIVEAQALIEASIDFSDEDDVPPELVARVADLARQLAASMRAELRLGEAGEIIREGFHVVIAGPPNVGKSSLMNALARRDVAIVSPYAGTTRDLIEVRLDLAGLPVVLTDTAGIRDSADAVESEGIRRGLGAAGRADLVLWLFESGARDTGARPAFAAPVVEIATKADLHGLDPRAALSIAATTSAGLPALLDVIAREAGARLAGAEGALVNRERHRQGLAAAATALVAAAEATPATPPELLAEHLRAAAAALARLVGRIDVEEVLEAIFARFCIGK